jgi:hypothetical protein
MWNTEVSCSAHWCSTRNECRQPVGAAEFAGDVDFGGFTVFRPQLGPTSPAARRADPHNPGDIARLCTISIYRRLTGDGKRICSAAGTVLAL